MASRFLVAVARPGKPIASLQQRLRASLPLPFACEAPGLSAFADKPEILCPLPNAGGLIVGSVFSRAEGYPTISKVSDADSAAIRRSLGGGLGARMWGSYLAFVRALDAESVAIVRERHGYEGARADE